MEINGIKINSDKHNLPVQLDGDGGDTAQRLGLIGIAEAFLDTNTNYFLAGIKKLEVSPGRYVRHPDQWNDPKDFSRDQTTPIVIALGFWGRKTELWNLWRKNKFFRYPNRDIASPEHVGYYIRALRLKWLYPWLWLGDLFMVLGSIILNIRANDLDYVGDDLNHTCALIQANSIMPTWFSRLAARIYLDFRPSSFGTTELKELNHVLGAWKWYFRPETGASPFDKLMEPVIIRKLIFYDYKISNAPVI